MSEVSEILQLVHCYCNATEFRGIVNQRPLYMQALSVQMLNWWPWQAMDRQP